MNFPFVEKKCAECGKNFIPAIEHIFKDERDGKTLWFCGYTCNCAFNRKHPKVKGSRWKNK